MGIDAKIKKVPNFAKLEMILTRTVPVTTSGSTVNYTSISHGLKYKPIVMAYVVGTTISSITTDGTIPLPTSTSVNIDTTNDVVEHKNWIFASVDSSQVHIILYNSTGETYTVNVKYILLRERSE